MYNGNPTANVGNCGEYMPGLKEIAQAANVSIRTVSRVLKGRGSVSESARKAVEQVISELGYTPNLAARSLRMNRSYEIVVLGWSFDELHLPKLAGLESVMRQADYSVSVYFDDPTGNDVPQSILANLETRRPAGVVMLRMLTMNCRWWEEQLERIGIPYVFIDPSPKDKTRAGVYIDRAQGVYESIKYLAGSGRKRIAYFGNNDNSRLDGYRRAIAELGMEKIEITFGPLAGQSPQAVRSNMDKLLAASPDSVQTYSDVVAMLLLGSLHDRGVKIPRDIAVVGFDDRPVAALAWPPLSTVAQPSIAAGNAAAEILLDRINGKPQPAEGWLRVLPTELVLRQSS